MINFLVLILKYYDLFDPVLAISVQILIIYLNPGVPTSHTGPFYKPSTATWGLSVMSDWLCISLLFSKLGNKSKVSILSNNQIHLPKEKGDLNLFSYCHKLICISTKLCLVVDWE